MTKDRPRNRPKSRGESGDSAPGGADRPWKSHGGGGRGGPAKPGARPWGKPARSGRPEDRKASFEEDGQVWIWGVHAVSAVLANPRRKPSLLLASQNALPRVGLDADALPAFAQMQEPREIDHRLPPDAVHQGVAVRVPALETPVIDDFVLRPERPIAILDQVTDPQNVGAVFRSAAAFGVAGVVMQTRNAPALGGALAKAAAGAIETIDEIRTVNISRAIDALTDAGWNVVGLDGSAQATLEEAFAGPRPLAIVLGAEGNGLRHGVAQACTQLARIPMEPGMESLNVSNAAAIAFYEASRRRHSQLQPAPPRPDAGADAEADETD